MSNLKVTKGRYEAEEISKLRNHQVFLGHWSCLWLGLAVCMPGISLQHASCCCRYITGVTSIQHHIQIAGQEIKKKNRKEVHWRTQSLFSEAKRKVPIISAPCKTDTQGSLQKSSRHSTPSFQGYGSRTNEYNVAPLGAQKHRNEKSLVVFPQW